MDPRDNLLRVYKELADWYERQRQPQMRDRFLVLAADAALLANKVDEADRLRLRLLKVNPHHMLKPYASFAQALKAPDVLTYVKDLRVNYPADVAEDLLHTLQADDKRPVAGVPATVPPGVAFDGSVTAPLPFAEGDTFRNNQDEEPDLAQTAAPGPLNAPRRPLAPPAPPQTIPLQGQNAARPVAMPIRSATPPRAGPVASRRPLPAPLPPDARTSPQQHTGEPAASGGSWLAVLLFLLVAVSGLALTGFTLLRPYLQLP